jgi:hypothetical protein
MPNLKPRSVTVNVGIASQSYQNLSQGESALGSLAVVTKIITNNRIHSMSRSSELISPSKGTQHYLKSMGQPEKPGPTMSQLMVWAKAQSESYIKPTLKHMRDTRYADGSVVLREIPHRIFLLQRSDKTRTDCPFCREQADPFLAEYDYMNMIFSQNLGPYDAASFLLRPRRLPSGGHNNQAETTSFLSSLGPNLLDDLPIGATLFSNQLAGNSQSHLHFQLIGCLLPIAEYVGHSATGRQSSWSPTGIGEADYVMVDNYERDNKVSSKEKPFSYLQGCLLRGSAKGVANSAVHYLSVARDRVTDRFNFTAWRDEQTNAIVMYVVLRDPKTLETTSNQPPHTVGALSTAGLIIDESFANNASKPFNYKEFVNLMATKIMPPCSEAFPVN